MMLSAEAAGGGDAAGATPAGVPVPRCYTFGCPPVVTSELAARWGGVVTAVVCGGDLVPRFSTAAVRRYRRRLRACEWRGALGREVAESEAAQFVREVKRSALVGAVRAPAAAWRAWCDLHAPRA